MAKIVLFGELKMFVVVGFVLVRCPVHIFIHDKRTREMGKWTIIL